MEQFFGRGEIAAAWHEFHAPLIALGFSAGLALAGWRLRAALVTLLAGGGAVLVGWWIIVRPRFVLPPHTAAERLAVLAGVTLLIALAAERLAARRGVWPPLIVAAIGCGWVMAGGPRSLSGLIAGLPVELATAAAVIAFAWLSGIATPVAEPIRPLMAALTLAGALRTVGAPWLWLLIALTPAAAVVPLMFIRALPPLVLLPLAADLAVAEVAVSLSAGRLVRGGFTATDAAALSPLLALCLFPYAARRLGAAGRFGAWLAAIASGVVAITAAWAVMRLRR